LTASGNGRRARQVLEESWAVEPNPAIAAAYLGDEADVQARVKAVEALIRRNPSAAESRLLLAQVALAAGLTGRARGALQALSVSGEADRRSFLALAELEVAEHGETTEAKEAQAKWLREAARAPAEPHWRCGNCGKVHEAWVGVCDGCGSFGQVAWGHAARVAAAAD
jgi:HemY protein